MKRIKQVSKEAYNIGKEWGWGKFECTHGYGVFDGDYPTKYGYITADHIEVIGIMDCWKLDIDAAKHAERYCGYKIIRDIDGLDHVFIDTTENRECIIKQIKENKNESIFL